MQIRRKLFETSSSSASAMVVVSEKTGNEEIHLEEPFDIVEGAYDIAYDGAPHVYLTDWRSKLCFMIYDTWTEDLPLLQRIVKKRTGQKFRLLYLWRKKAALCDMETVEKHQAEESASALLSWCSRIPEWREGESYAKYFFLDGYLCAIGSEYDEDVILLPADMDGSDYGLERMLYYGPEGMEHADYFDRHREDRSALYEEIIFNDSIGINVGGDAYEYDFRRGMPGKSLLPVLKSVPYADSQEALRMKNYAQLEIMTMNGNEFLWIGLDGTKLRICTEEESIPEYPDIIDLKVTDRCDNKCPFCYENSSPRGRHGWLNHPFLKTIPSFVEIAIGGGNPLAFPDLEEALHLTDIVNITLHSNDWVQRKERYSGDYDPMFDGVKAVGISLTSKEDFEKCASFRLVHVVPNKEGMYPDWKTDLVFHIVNGVADQELLEAMYDKGIKILILGFKDKGRGMDFKSVNMEKFQRNTKWLYDNLEELVKHFSVVSFDILALEQLDVKRLVSDEDWDKYFMGKDGSHSMYIDLVKREFGISSTDERRWPLMDDIRDMFRVVREECGLPVWRSDTSPGKSFARTGDYINENGADKRKTEIRGI